VGGRKAVGEHETVLVFFKKPSLAAMAEGLSAQQRPPFAYGNDTAPDDWGVIVHHMAREIAPGVHFECSSGSPCS
jgi:hypothetical protein